MAKECWSGGQNSHKPFQPQKQFQSNYKPNNAQSFKKSSNNLFHAVQVVDKLANTLGNAKMDTFLKMLPEDMANNY